MYLSDIEVGQKIGGGAFGEVFQGFWNKQPVALKKLLQTQLIEEFTAEADMLM